MKSVLANVQSIVKESYQIPWLPPLWEVIYQEGVRSNHLLFSKEEQKHFASRELYKSSTIADIYSDDLEEIILKLLCCSDLSSLIKTVESQSIETREKLYHLYLHSLNVSRRIHKGSLN